MYYYYSPPDTSIAELIKERTDKETFMDSLQTQQGDDDIHSLVKDTL